MNSEGDARRFCDVCTKHVHDLSSMTERQARAVLAEESTKGRVCVRYKPERDGSVKFKAETVAAPSLWRTTLAAAGMTLALLTGCTDSEPDRVLDDRCVYELGPWDFTAARGQGTCPAVEEPEADPVEMMGEIAIEPQIEPQIEVMGDVAAIPEPPPEPMVMGEAPVFEPPPPEPEPMRMGKIAPAQFDVHEDPSAPCDPLAEAPADRGPRRL